MSEGSEQDTQPLDFFRAIWPAQGWYCIAVKTPRGMHQQFFATMEEAAAFALAADARGIEVYHGCAVYKEPGSRKAANVRAVKCFWMDIDVGEGKPYADPKTAVLSVEQFVRAANLPSPSYVFSGRGWHLYWVLEREISPDEWAPRAQDLKRRAAALGLAADPARTGDIASILRPPGTHNRKGDRASPVIAGPFTRRSSPDEYNPAGGIGDASVRIDNDKFKVPYTGEQEPAYGNVIADQCGQIKNFRDSRGKLPEPEWYAGLCVLGHCADGPALAHEWSSGDSRYDYQDTERKLEHARKDSGPTTCSRFQSLNPGPCLGCPHAGKISSPIQLGRGANGTPVAAVQLPALRFPFSWSANGALSVRVEGEEPGTSVWEVVYKAPLFVDRIRQNELTEHRSLALKHWLPHEGWREIVLPWDDHSAKTVMNRLGAAGVNAHGPSSKHLLRYLHDAIDDYEANRKVEMEYTQFGWKGDFEGFLLGAELFTPGQPPRPVGVTPELHQRSMGMKAYGTFEAWRGAANSLFAFERQGLMVVAGFASVLMAFAQDAGGLIIAAVSEEGGKGKTLGLRGAQSAWGSESVTAISKTDTVNSRFRLISLLGGLPVTWDEMRDRDPDVVKDFVLTFSGGRDKNRLDRTASLKQNARSWSTMLIATSNISVAELVSHDGETAQQARILETVFEDLTGVKASDGKEIERQLLINRGHAGRRFVQALMLPGMIDWCRQAVPFYAREFEKELGESNTVLRFYTNGLACIKAASVILNKAHILEFSTERICDYALSCARKMGGTLIDARKDPSYILTRCINENWSHALVVPEAWKPKQNVLPILVPRGALSIRVEKETGRVFIDRQFLKDWCSKRRVMFSHLGQRLLEDGTATALDRRINLGAGTSYAAGGQTTVWEVRREALVGLEIPESNVVRLK